MIIIVYNLSCPVLINSKSNIKLLAKLFSLQTQIKVNSFLVKADGCFLSIDS